MAENSDKKEKTWDESHVFLMANILNRLQFQARCCDSYYADRPELRQAISDARMILEKFKDHLEPS